MLVKTKVVLDHVLVPLQHEPSAGVPSYIEALVTTLPQPSRTLSPSSSSIIIIIIITILIIVTIINLPGLLSNRNPAFGESCAQLWLMRAPSI